MQNIRVTNLINIREIPNDASELENIISSALKSAEICTHLECKQIEGLFHVQCTALGLVASYPLNGQRKEEELPLIAVGKTKEQALMSYLFGMLSPTSVLDTPNLFRNAKPQAPLNTTASAHIATYCHWIQKNIPVVTKFPDRDDLVAKLRHKLVYN